MRMTQDAKAERAAVPLESIPADVWCAAIDNLRLRGGQSYAVILNRLVEAARELVVTSEAA